jgi:hypothetical protein
MINKSFSITEKGFLPSMLKSIRILIFAGLAIYFSTGCNSRGTLTTMEKQKLDIQLQKLITEEDMPEGLYNISTDDSGLKRFGVIITVSDTSALRKAGIPVSSMHAGIVTAKLTVEELRRATEIPEVISIKNTSKSYPQ